MDKVLLLENGREEQVLTGLLKDHGYEVLTSESLDLLCEARQVLPGTPLVIVTGRGAVVIASVVESMKQGFLERVTTPVNQEEILMVLHRAVEKSQLEREACRMRLSVEEQGGLQGMVGNSEPMRRVFEQVHLVAPGRSTVLITGESGTGKELLARAIHQLSPRRDGPFIVLNCVAIPRELAESELFGHTKGAFTGATDRRIGKFAAADRGTLLIDEIGEMELAVQAKLLRALETRSISPIGSNEEQRVDVRVLAATHRNLRSLVGDGRFREDLYYRLHVVHIDLPPLRQRREDIPLLVATFLEQLNKEHDRNMRNVTLEAMDVLKSYDWPGNIRESRNVLEGILVLSRKEVIELVDLPLDIKSGNSREPATPFLAGVNLSELERGAIQETLIQTGGNRQKSARLLGISTRTLLRKIQEYALKDPRRTGGRAPVESSSPFTS